MKLGRQTTLRRPATISGVGVHSGLRATLTLLPAAVDTGIVFVRIGEDGSRMREVRADVRAVTATEFATVLGDADGPMCATAEHVLAALAGLGVDNVVIEIDGPEVPIMDGSAAPFVDAVDSAGVVSQAAPRRCIRILRPVRVEEGNAVGELLPYSGGFRVEVDIDFPGSPIGRQALAVDVTPVTFRRELARARTFGFMRDVSKLWSAGYALGASFDNTVVINEDRVLNPDGLRFADEFARHKALDALGDMRLAGAPLIGHYRSVRGGHRLNYAVLSALMADTSAWTLVSGEGPRVEAGRRVRGHGELAGAIAAPAFAPEVS